MESFPSPIEFTFRDINDVRALRVAADLTENESFREMADLGGTGVVEIFNDEPVEGKTVTVPAELRRELVAAVTPSFGALMERAADGERNLQRAKPHEVAVYHQDACNYKNALNRVHDALAPDHE